MEQQIEILKRKEKVIEEKSRVLKKSESNTIIEEISNELIEAT
jgi:hypothetical protein